MLADQVNNNTNAYKTSDVEKYFEGSHSILKSS